MSGQDWAGRIVGLQEKLHTNTWRIWQPDTIRTEKAMKEQVEVLKTERLRRGLTLHEIAERSQINLSILKALEQGDFERIGPPKIIQGLLKDYCTLLGIDEDLLKGGRQAQKQPPEEAAPPPDEEFEPTPQADAYKPDRKKPYKRIVLGFCLGLLTVGVIVGVMWLIGERCVDSDYTSVAPQTDLQADSPPGLQEKTQQPKQQGNLPLQSKQDSKSEEQASSPKASVPDWESSWAEAVYALSSKSNEHREMPAQPPFPSDKAQNTIVSSPVPARTETPASVPKDELNHHLELRADEKSWIQVTVDGKQTESYLLQPGEKREWWGKESMRVILGNGGGISVKWDGKPVEISKGDRAIRLSLPDAILGKQ